MDPALVLRIVAERNKTGDIFFFNIAAFGGNLGNHVEIGEGSHFLPPQQQAVPSPFSCRK